MRGPKAVASDPITIVTACDENYVRAAAASIGSAIFSLGQRQDAKIYVLDGGIAESSKSKLLRSWASRRVQVTWLKPDLEAIHDLPVSEHVSLSTYLRLLLAELLPIDSTKAIYLDADTIVVRNLADLWSVPLDGTYCAAVQEVLFPVLDPREVFWRPLHCMTMPQMDERPIPNYRALGLSSAAPYFNAGMMLVNVARWREEQVARRAFECLRANAEHVRFWDQYALNVLFSSQWKMLDPRWNQNSHVFQLPSWELSHYTEQELDELKRDPWIVHFNDQPKPWDSQCNHPLRRLFFEHLDRTGWRSWRPSAMREQSTDVAATVRLAGRRPLSQRLLGPWRKAA